MKVKQKDFGLLGAILVAAVVVAITVVVALQKGIVSVTEEGTIPLSGAVESAADLEAVTTDLDTADLGELDQELNKLEADSATF